MQREKLDIKHKKTLQPLLEKQRLLLSEFSFATLYLFRKKHNYEVVFAKNPFIMGVSYHNVRFLMPTTKEQLKEPKKLISLLKLFACEYIYPIDDTWLDAVDTHYFLTVNKEENNDYVYPAERLKTYAGRRLSKKRNLVKQFLENYTPRSVSLEKEQKKDAQYILDLWEQTIGGDDYEACREALLLFEDLALTGDIFYVQDVPVGFVIGEFAHDDMYIIHFAKANKTYKGIYQYMYQDFAKRLPESVRYVNMEQDLGDEGLRQAKRSYLPTQYVKKWMLYPKS